ncbi:MAG: ABC-2 transporter permease [Acidobacteria bacterium]|nr:ABC-2 transporter permease [Acidobacteriota bacterium]MCB9396905.1 ABC-2 transporter permease [Acidobacteriota bacterium]
MQQKSEIFEGGLESWDGDRKSSTPPAVLIGYYGFRNIIASSGCIGRSLFFTTLSIFYAVLLFMTVVRHQAEAIARIDFLAFLADWGKTLREYDEAFYQKGSLTYPAFIILFFMMIFWGSQLISKDRAANAMQIYFSKALTPVDYLLGKYMTVGILIGSVTLIPSIFMFVLGVALSPELGHFLATSWYVPIIGGVYWLFLTLSIGTMVLFFSSLFNRSYMAAVAFAGFFGFSLAVSAALTKIIGARDMVLGLNWWSTLHDIGVTIFDLEITPGTPFFWQLIDLSVVCGVFLWFIWQRIKPVEVVR